MGQGQDQTLNRFAVRLATDYFYGPSMATIELSKQVVSNILSTNIMRDPEGDSDPTWKTRGGYVS